MRLLQIFFFAFCCTSGTVAFAGPHAATLVAYKVTISGTSNLHDWDEQVNKVAAFANISRNTDGTLNIESFSVTMDVYSIKSHEGSIMDRNTYKALKAADHPEISYVLTAPALSISINGGSYTLTAKGSLTIAGVKKEVIMVVKILPENGKIVFEGNQKIAMTDYGITPPTAMFGALKTGNEITINYQMTFNNSDGI